MSIFCHICCWTEISLFFLRCVKDWLRVQTPSLGFWIPPQLGKGMKTPAGKTEPCTLVMNFSVSSVWKTVQKVESAHAYYNTCQLNHNPVCCLHQRESLTLTFHQRATLVSPVSPKKAWNSEQSRSDRAPPRSWRKILSGSTCLPCSDFPSSPKLNHIQTHIIKN